MAIEFTFASPDGRDCPAAYARISRVAISTPVGIAPSIEIRVDVFADAKARAQAKRPVHAMDFTLRDLPAVVRERPVLDAQGFPTGKTESVEVEAASPAFSEAIAKVGSMDPVALAYESIMERPEFTGRKAV